MRRPRQPATGFSLLELLAVITILGILAATVMSRLSTQAFDAKKKCCLQYQRDLNAAMEHFHFEHGNFPAQLDNLHPTYYPESIPICPVTKLPYQIDAATHRIEGHHH
jgi:general secretion pathway protein G